VADDEQCLDVAGLAVPLAGGLRETGDPWAPFELADPVGAVVGAVADLCTYVAQRPALAAALAMYMPEPLDANEILSIGWRRAPSLDTWLMPVIERFSRL
jgi:ABC-type amino acid transport substrate-binding protein